MDLTNRSKTMEALHLPETERVEQVVSSVSRDGTYIIMEHGASYVIIERKYLPELISWLTRVMEDS